MACQVAKCRFPKTHVTPFHKCENCKHYGHGKIECPYLNNNDYTLLNNLYSKIIIPINKKKYCTIKNCPIPNTHSNSAHQSDFDKYGIMCKK